MDDLRSIEVDREEVREVIRRCGAWAGTECDVKEVTFDEEAAAVETEIEGELADKGEEKNDELAAGADVVNEAAEKRGLLFVPVEKSLQAKEEGVDRGKRGCALGGQRRGPEKIGNFRECEEGGDRSDQAIERRPFLWRIEPLRSKATAQFSERRNDGLLERAEAHHPGLTFFGCGIHHVIGRFFDTAFSLYVKVLAEFEGSRPLAKSSKLRNGGAFSKSPNFLQE
jgi:hypothetical protein